MGLSVEKTWLKQSMPCKGLSDDQLQTLLGQYTADAMEILDRQNARVLKCSKEESHPKELLNSGLWYSTQYLSAVKKYPEKHALMLRQDALQQGYMEETYWKRIGPYQFTLKSSDRTPSECLMGILEGKTLCLLECMTTVCIAHYCALLRVLGEDRFDKLFSGVSPHTLTLKISPYNVRNPIYLFLLGTRVGDFSDLSLGDKVGYKNHPRYSQKHPFGEARAWNIICIEKARDVKFTSFGFEGVRLTESGLKRKLIEAYNEAPLCDPAILGSLMHTRQPHLEMFSYPPQISEKEFDKHQSHSLEVIRLCASRVNLLLSSTLDELTLLDVFHETSERAQSFAMDDETLMLWETATREHVLR